MSYGADLGAVLGVGSSTTQTQTSNKKTQIQTGEQVSQAELQGKVQKYGNKSKAGQSLDMTDYLTLMVEMLKNQDIDNTADMNEMMGQMVQMSVIQAITEITDVINESSTLNYAASLVGKEVTIGQYEGKTLHEIVGTVTATGTLNGKQVVFIGDDSYYLTDVMAIGRLPKDPESVVPDSDKDSNPDSDSDKDSDSASDSKSL